MRYQVELLGGAKPPRNSPEHVNENCSVGTKPAWSRPISGTSTVRFGQLRYHVELLGGAEAPARRVQELRDSPEHVSESFSPGTKPAWSRPTSSTHTVRFGQLRYHVP